MDDRVELLITERPPQLPLVRHVGYAQRRTCRDVGARPRRKVVDGDDGIAARHERIDDRAADEAGTAGDKYAHLLGAPFPQLWTTLSG